MWDSKIAIGVAETMVLEYSRAAKLWQGCLKPWFGKTWGSKTVIGVSETWARGKGSNKTVIGVSESCYKVPFPTLGQKSRKIHYS